jgi:hypothetical protein
MGDCGALIRRFGRVGLVEMAAAGFAVPSVPAWRGAATIRRRTGRQARRWEALVPASSQDLRSFKIIDLIC